MGIRQFSNFFIITFLAIGTAKFAKAQSNGLSTVENLNLRLYEYADDNLSFSSNINEASVLGFYLTTLDEFEYLSICNSDSFSIWKSGQMIKDYNLCWEQVRSSIMQQDQEDTVYLTLMSKGNFSNLSINLLAENISTITVDNLPEARKIHYFQEWAIFMLSLIGLFTALIRITNPSLFVYLTKVRWVTTREDEIEFEFNIDMILAIIFVSLITVFNYQLIIHWNSDQEILSTGFLLLESIWYVILLALFFLAKYFFIYLMAKINALAAIVGTQFIEFIKFFSVAGLLFVLLMQAWYWLGYYTDFKSGWIIENFYLLVYSLFIGYFFLKLAQQTHYKKLHIISYLCTTEFIGVFLLALIIYK